ncbi:MAG: FKBP-type peptidyl-prolyl cis-trans isomerase, partial [Alistipes sp.]|nr:FKBP-type peptidyl-prolyl cis-trans isomerase [Alistipes sp.]
ITLWVPSELAYGQRGPGSIGPNQALRFDVEVIDVEPFVDPAAAAAEAEAAEQTVEE